MPIEFRPLTTSETGLALDLWVTVFGAPRAYFARYFGAGDPWHQAGDTLGAWADKTLVSAVHLCRRPVAWEGRTLLCGGIANVATLPEYRRQGVSRELLRRLVAHMEEIGCHFSLLGTGSPQHYAALGWEQTHSPRARITLDPITITAASVFTGLTPDPTAAVQAIYARCPRPLQFERPSAYFEGWVGGKWGQESARLHILPERGYVLLAVPEAENSPAALLEWRAADADTEQSLLRAAAQEAHRLGRTHLEAGPAPQHCAPDFLNSFGAVQSRRETGIMIRNVALNPAEYPQVRDACRSGAAVGWSADGF